MLAGRYSINELLGQGGMATVYRGTDVKLGRQVAIKIMRANLADDEQFRSRFRQEAQSASRLAHPSVVRVLDAGDDLIQSATGPQRLPFIVMEYVDGQNLRELAAEQQLTIAETCRVVDSVLTALEYSHRAGLVHRDIKPANIMITKSGQVKVMDFGIARAVSETSSTVQQTTAILGTAAYFSPEQAKGETVDTRTDLYSTGVLLYELLTGMVPFRGETAVAVAYQHVSERPQAPSTHNGEISAPLDRVVLHALAKDRNRRFQTASEFRDALRQAAAGIMPKLSNDDEQSSVLFNTSEDISESDLALRRLSETGGSTRSQSRPPVMWVWASILTIVAVIAAVAFWVASMAPSSLIPANSREIPKFAGIEQSVAIKQLLDLDLQPVVEEITDDDTDAGDVVRTDPAAGELVAIDTTVTVFVSIGPENPKVPSFDRMSLEEYTVAVEALGLTVGSVSNADDPTAPEGRVLQVAPEPGAALKRGDAIGVTVSTGMVKIPDVKGQSLEVARNLLEGLASVTPEPRGDCATSPGFPVIEQSMMGQQAQGSEITLAYCSG
jgi:serine/threonine-protein kinase